MSVVVVVRIWSTNSFRTGNLARVESGIEASLEHELGSFVWRCAFNRVVVGWLNFDGPLLARRGTELEVFFVGVLVVSKARLPSV